MLKKHSMWYREISNNCFLKCSVKGHKKFYDFNDLSYELKFVSDSNDSDFKSENREIRYILKAYDLEHKDKDHPVGKMEFTLTYYKTGKKQLDISLVRTDDWHEGMGVATNLYKWLKYNIEIFDKPEWLTSNPFNTQASRIREKIFGEPSRTKPVHEYEMDYTQRKLDL